MAAAMTQSTEASPAVYTLLLSLRTSFYLLQFVMLLVEIILLSHSSTCTWFLVFARLALSLKIMS